MSKRYPKARWVLPEIVDPPERICYTIEVPNERQHIAAFNGALLNLTSAMQWADDAAHTAKDVALVWRGVIDDIVKGECNVPVQFRQPDLCTLEASYDGGETWSLIYDATACVVNGATELIEGYLEDGTLGGSQRGPDGEAPSGFCKKYHVTLPGNQRWLAPIPIKAGYRVTITNARGGATDGTFSWYCPQGTSYSLGDCGEIDVPAQMGDPLQSVNHMRLVMQYNSNFFDAYNLVHTVSSGLVGEHDLELQVNDGSLGDNSGTYQFDIEICNVGVCGVVAVYLGSNMPLTPTSGVYTFSATDTDPAANNAYQMTIYTGDPNNDPCACREILIETLTGYLGADEESNFNSGGILRCDTTFIGTPINTNWQTWYNGQSELNKCGYAYNLKSQTPFTMTFRVVDC